MSHLLETIDAHTAGEPLRIVTGGIPPIEGDTIGSKRRWAAAHVDGLRRALMWEPRGHADMYGAILTEPTTPDGDVGVLFMHNEGWSTMCGHGIIALASVGLAEGLFDADPQRIRFDTPAGRVTARHEGGSSASFVNVESYVAHRDARLDVEGIGPVRCDVAFGGAFYAYVDAADVGVRIGPDTMREAVDVGRAVKAAAVAQLPLEHPDTDMAFLYGAILVGPAEGEVHSRNVCVFADGEVDRSPTGTGVSGRAAIHHARGELAVGGELVIESLIGTRFTVRIVEATERGVIPEVRGRAWLTGRHTFVIADDDPLAEGFLLR